MDTSATSAALTRPNARGRLRPVEEMTLGSSLSWIRRTIAQDRQFFVPRPRRMTAGRIASSLWPRLDRPVFIIGAPRSGTTFLGECLAALPEISYHFEPVATKAAGRYVFEGAWSFRRSRFVFRATYWLLLALHGNGDLRFAEKTPQNCFLVSFLARAFPGARFVHIVRDGRDAALSYSKKPWLRADAAAPGDREAGGYLNGPHARYWVEPERRAEFESTSDFHRCVWAWRLHTESALQQTASLSPGSCHELRYEDLVARPDEEASRLLAFLQIDAPRSIEPFMRALQRRSQKSVGSWTRELTPVQVDEAEMEAGPLLRRLGYAAPDIV
jgi:hypothetical protein